MPTILQVFGLPLALLRNKMGLICRFSNCFCQRKNYSQYGNNQTPNKMDKCSCQSREEKNVRHV